MADKLLTAAQLIDMLELYNHKELQVHHTWRPNHSNFTGKNYQKIQDGMRNHHKNNNGWSDIAQHVTLFPDGKFLTGRPFNQSPAGITGYNAGTFMVEMVGDFDKGKDKFEGPQKEAMLTLARFFDSRGKYIRFHRENAPKTCPGTGIDKNQFVAEVRQVVKGASVKKEEVKVAEVFSPSTPVLKERAQTVLSRFNKKENGPLDKAWLDKLNKDELTDSDMIGLIYNAVFNGHIGNVELIAKLQKENEEMKKRIDKLEGIS